MNVAILKLDEVMKRTGLSRSTIYASIKEKIFPQQVPIGKKSVGWVEAEINDWIFSQIMKRSG